MRRTRLAALLAAAALVIAGCGGGAPSGERAGEGRGGEGGGDGVATLWVTRERGTVLMLDTTVAAGQTLLRALRSQAVVETRYGGRFVQSIDGLAGSASAQRDWFWFVNGLAGDRSAAEYRLRDGDLAWWDYRGWRDDAALEVVVGAFPEPFLHGYGGRVRPVAVRYRAAALRGAAERVARLLRATDVAEAATPAPEEAHLFELASGTPRFTASLRRPGEGPTAPVRFVFAGDVDWLLGRERPFVRRFALP